MASHLVYHQKIFDVSTAELYRVELFVANNNNDHDHDEDKESASAVPLESELGYYAVDDTIRILLESASTLPENIQPLVSINVAASILFDADILDVVMSRLNDLPYGLSIEVSQFSDLPEPRKVNARFSQFRKINCTIELDNFGGLSAKNPQVFSEYCFDSLKLDPKFVHNTVFNEKRLRLLSLVADMVKAQGKRIIATGVTTKAISDKLAELGIVLQQGDFIHAPQRLA